MVYLLKTEDSKFVKIGFTRDSINLRIQSLQTGSPLSVTCIEIIEHGGRMLEKYLHYKCKKFSKKGEWFHYNNDFITIWDAEKSKTELEAQELLKQLKLCASVIEESDYSRIDILLDKPTLKWASMEAVKLGISRRRFLALCVETTFNEQV